MFVYADGWMWEDSWDEDGCSECDAHLLTACSELRTEDCARDFVWKRHVKVGNGCGGSVYDLHVYDYWS